MSTQPRKPTQRKLEVGELLRSNAAGERVVITDIDIPFGRMVGLALMWMLASLPAALVAGLILWAVASAMMPEIP